MAADKQRGTHALIDARGRSLIERRGLRRHRLASDAYHFLRTATWTRIVVLFAGLFVAVNLAFATVLWLGGARIAYAHGYLDDFWFSVQSIATIGYGHLYPTGPFANTMVTIESFFGIIFTALVTGIFFARFATPSARVLFSKVAVITDHEGQRAFQLRMANERSTVIVEVTVRAYLTRDEVLSSGEHMRRVYDLPLRRSTSPIFALSFLVMHPIDEASPLYGETAESLRAANVNIVVTVTGIDDQLAATVHARYVYGAGDIEIDRRFVDLFRTDPKTGRRYIDLVPMHDTVPLNPPELADGSNDSSQLTR